MSPAMTRRTFTKAAAITTFTAASYSRVYGAGDTVRIEMRDAKRHSIFGAIEQVVAAE